MRAIVQYEYGGPDVLKMLDVEKPTVKDHELLVEVHYANIASGDMRINTLDAPGFIKPIMRLIFGWNKPRRSVRGISGSGRVVDVGRNVKNFEVGDRVYFINSLKAGVMADYVVLKETGKVVKIPESVSYQQAAPVAFGAMSAFHFINDSSVNERDEVMVYGASGSVGSYAIQLAKFYGAKVTAVCSEKNRSVIKELGADNIIDYRTTDLEELLTKYDIIFDAVNKIDKKEVAHLLKVDGKFLSIKNPTAEKVDRLLKLNRIMENEQLHSLIEKVYPFDMFVEAHKHVYSKHKVGNVLLEIKGSE